eukprot:TRINITY_DN552_c0_g1_i20.p2 TRINITY_DN552_c0_g1~~TRINITY_DN552_c0_g1_i20.p2  ORF type:complete len:182 (+),score=103.61 TRINITY_DN552_c0_g1_i20:48-548(+)
MCIRDRVSTQSTWGQIKKIKIIKQNQKTMLQKLNINLISNIYYSFATVRRYTKEHEWVSVDTDKNEGLVGLSTHASDQMGELVYLELPEIGKEVGQMGECGALESVKVAATIYSPVGGKVLEVNEPLAKAPKQINENPENTWVYNCLLYTSPSPRDVEETRMPSSA